MDHPLQSIWPEIYFESEQLQDWQIEKQLKWRLLPMLSDQVMDLIQQAVSQLDLNQSVLQLI